VGRLVVLVPSDRLLAGPVGGGSAGGNTASDAVATPNTALYFSSSSLVVDEIVAFVVTLAPPCHRLTPRHARTILSPVTLRSNTLIALAPSSDMLQYSSPPDLLHIHKRRGPPQSRPVLRLVTLPPLHYLACKTL
jgi:hypothetical protein